MKAVILRGKYDVAIETVPDAKVQFPTDAVVQVVAAAICGTDLRGYGGLPGPVHGPRCGHEFVGLVTEVGAEVSRLRPGMLVVAPFVFSDGTCVQCVRGLPSSCASGGMFGVDCDGGQAEAVRVPFADATLVEVPMDEHDERIPAVLALADVMATGFHAMHTARVGPDTSVAIVGDGPVGLCSVLAARALGAKRIMMLGRHGCRTRIGRSFGATDVMESSGTGTVAEGIDFVLSRSDGSGVDVVAECTGESAALDTALGSCRDGGTMSLVGGPHGEAGQMMACFLRNITVTGGLAPAGAYLPALLDDVLAERLDPGPIFDLTVSLDEIASGYEAMRSRTVTKVLVQV
ncbi:alcohol dehydrogenase catalytic domain-containing protein [Amycolatopsis sp. NPDC049868]|uniref:alcohol dehydrogenase catalytic domain-containing protein n=1 Tax=Amycolatopsis sp. NPDC049868 TaxID=3363934 RepID=UPI0037963443